MKFASKKEKNRINKLGIDYFEFIQANSLSHFKMIESFLKDPRNRKFARFYENTISDLQAKIILKRNAYQDFEHLIEDLINFVIDSNGDELEEMSKMVRVFFHFMYFNCDIGKK